MTTPATRWLVAVDIDGTLLHGSRLFDEDVAAIRDFHDLGGKVVLATGRIPAMTLPIAKQLEAEGPHICANGAWIGSEHHGLVRSRPFTPSERAPLLDLARDPVYASGTVAYAENAGFVETLSSTLRAYQEERLAPLREDLDFAKSATEDLLKVMFFVAESQMESLGAQLAALEASYEVRMGLPGSLAGLPDIVSVEVSPPGVDKHTAFEQLAEQLGFARHETAAVGDGSNDIRMLQWAQRGFAVAGGDGGAIAAAGAVVGDDGVPPVTQALRLLRQG